MSKNKEAIEMCFSALIKANEYLDHAEFLSRYVGDYKLGALISEADGKVWAAHDYLEKRNEGSPE